MSRDERLERHLRFDVFPNDTTKRNLRETLVCFNCRGEVEMALWESYNIPAELNDLDQPFCTPSCFLNAIREYRSQEQFLFVQQWLTNFLEEWMEPMMIDERAEDDADYANAKRQKI